MISSKARTARCIWPSAPARTACALRTPSLVIRREMVPSMFDGRWFLVFWWKSDFSRPRGDLIRVDLTENVRFAHECGPEPGIVLANMRLYAPESRRNDLMGEQPRALLDTSGPFGAGWRSGSGPNSFLAF